MKNWEELKVAYKVALLGTISAAAENLGVHRATVIRNINSLEKSLNEKLFIRHASGYTPTESGRALLRVVKVTDDQLSHLYKTLKGDSSEISGELIVTSMDFLAWMVIPLISALHLDHKDIKTHFISTSTTLRLEYGEAHIAFRVGAKPESVDNIALELAPYELGLYASKDYIRRHGTPKSLEEFYAHTFVLREGIPDLPFNANLVLPFEDWLSELVPEKNIALKVSKPLAIDIAIEQGIGIGFYPVRKAALNKNLIEIWPRETDWQFPVWVVTHTDMYHTEKVQAFLSILLEEGILSSRYSKQK